MSAAVAIMSWAAFASAHGGQPASTLTVTAQWHAAHGLVLHDGVCAYSSEALLGCYDPSAEPGGGRDLACSEPVIREHGVAWLHLHGETFALYTRAEQPVTEHAPLPLWAFAHTADPETDALLVWGFTREAPPTPPFAGQELWEWHPESGAAATRLALGPAELSGGIAPWPGEADCFALATYAPVEGPCEGSSTVWKWCRSDAARFEPTARFHGCSGKILAGRDAGGVSFWNVEADGSATVHRAAAEPAVVPTTIDHLAFATDPTGAVQRVTWNGRSVGTTRLSP